MATTGCVTFNKTTSNYIEPKPNDVLHTASVEIPFDTAWDMLIEGITKHIYVINNIEKASGLITVAFSSDDVEKWIDGGMITRNYGTSVFTFNGAADAVFLYDEQSGLYVVTYHITRKTSLDALANIHLRKVSETTTSISVNARYVVTINNVGYYNLKDWAGNIQETGEVPPAPLSLSLSTSTPAAVKGEYGFALPKYDLTLQNKGVFERYIISLIAPHLVE